MGKKHGRKKKGGAQAAKRKLKQVKLKPKAKLKLALGAKKYRELKQRCCDPKHPHCSGCPLVKALAKLS